MDVLIILFGIIIVGLFVGFVWNMIQFKNLREKTEGNQISDSRYFELKYKLEFYLAIFLVVTATAGLLGYKAYNDIVKSMQDSIKEKLKEPIATIDSIGIKSREAYEFINNFQAKQENLDASYETSKDRLDYIQKLAQRVSDNKILKQEINIVKDISFSPFKDGKWDPQGQRFEFKNLRNTLGEPLPEFSEPPIIIATINATATPQVYRITKTGFSLGLYSTDTIGVGADLGRGKISLLIYKIPN